MRICRSGQGRTEAEARDKLSLILQDLRKQYLAIEPDYDTWEQAADLHNVVFDDDGELVHIVTAWIRI